MIPVSLAQPLKGALAYLRALRLELGHLSQFAFIHAVEVRVVRLAGRALRVTSRLDFDEMTFKPADALLLGFVEN